MLISRTSLLRKKNNAHLNSAFNLISTAVKCIGKITRRIPLIVLCILLLLYSFRTNAQDAIKYAWAKNIGGTGGEQGQGIVIDASGNVYVTGFFALTTDFGPGKGSATFTSIGAQDVFIAKYDANGNYIWAKTIGGINSEQGTGIAVDASGNIYVTGYFNGAVDFDPGVATATLTSAGSSDGFVAKYDANGNYIWVKSMGGSAIDQGLGIAVDAQGNVCVSGYFNGTATFGSATFTSAGGNDAFLVKYDASGNYLWAKNLGGTAFEQGLGVATDGNSNIYMTGYFGGSVDFNSGGSGGVLASVGGGQDIFLIKYDANGNYIWAKSAGGTGVDQGLGISTDGNGNIYVTGYITTGPAKFDTSTLTSAGGQDVFVAKYNSSGNHIWAKNIGGTSADQGSSVSTDGDGNVYVTGSFNGTATVGSTTLTSAGGQDIFIAKYDVSGNSLWAKSMGGNTADRGRGVVVDAHGNVYMTGYFAGTVDLDPSASGTATFTATVGNDAFVLKLSPKCEIFNSLIESTCDSFRFNGVTYTSSGIYADTFASSTKCDSIVTLNLTINHTSSNSVERGNYCDSVTLNGQTYIASGMYTQHYTNISGCDSNIIYDLTIMQSNIDSIYQTTCDSFRWDDTTIHTATGIYTMILTNEAGCDSTLVLGLTINYTPKAVASLSGTTLHAGQAESYQWVNCDQGYSSLAGATDSIFTPTISGNYAVVMKAKGCSDTSDCVNVELSTGIYEISSSVINVQVYPNPVSNKVTLQAEQPLKNVMIRLVNAVGQLQLEQTYDQGILFTLDMYRYASGVYFVEIIEAGKLLRVKLVKE